MSKYIRLYRFFNLDQGKYGVPFALCDPHMTAYQRAKKPPAAANLILEKIADQAVWPCGDCEADVKLHLARAGAEDAGLTTEKLLGMLEKPL